MKKFWNTERTAAISAQASQPLEISRRAFTATLCCLPVTAVAASDTPQASTDLVAQRRKELAELASRLDEKPVALELHPALVFRP